MLLVILPLSVRAETVDLFFEPPQMEAIAVCTPRLADDALAARWEGADADNLPETDTGLIKRDLGRLIEMDPQHWFETAARIEAAFQTIDPGYSDLNMLIDRIELLLAAGRLGELQGDGLVERLAGMDLSRSPRAQNLLAGYLTNGVGIAKDARKAEALLLQAAQGGSAGAILTLVEREVSGSPVAGWTVPPDLGTTLAFGALVGKLDPLICDRVNRIAREYMSGKIVTRNPALAERWYRFSADLGDAVSAWRVAEMHLRAEDIAKDNDVLLHYLRQASAAGLPYAQVVLARAQTDGALLPRDLDAADATYRRAAQTWVPGLASHVLFLQAQSRRDAAWTPRYLTALQELAARPDAPAWALIAMADQVIVARGRWAGEAEALALAEKMRAEEERRTRMAADRQHADQVDAYMDQLAGRR
jgi:TPR repeat protein